ncbi:hypothetical protein IAR50_000132 [Cryptococcus sp. DSM 104548]
MPRHSKYHYEDYYEDLDDYYYSRPPPTRSEQHRSRRKSDSYYDCEYEMPSSSSMPTCASHSRQGPPSSSYYYTRYDLDSRRDSRPPNSSRSGYYHDEQGYGTSTRSKSRRRNSSYSHEQEYKRYLQRHADWEYSQINAVTIRIVNDLMPVLEHNLKSMSIRQRAPEFTAKRSRISASLAQQVQDTLEKEVSRREAKGKTEGDIRDVRFNADRFTLDQHGKELTIEGASIYGIGWSTGQKKFDLVFTAAGDGDDDD